jgi:cysteine-rich repeat protein
MTARITAPRGARRYPSGLVGIAVLAVAALSGSCLFASRTTLCEASGRRCSPGQVCAAGQDVCVDIGGCGDGLKADGEVCDDGNILDGDGCSADCRSDETCGNGVTDAAAGEHCDDGNLTTGDGCDDHCQPESKVCGNLIVDPEIGEDCDAGGVDVRGCNKNCTFARCGDGYANAAAMEECDSAGKITAACNGPLCTKPVCGDNFHNQAAGEACDTGGDTQACNGDTNADGTGNCSVPRCGDGYSNPMFTPPGSRARPEQCDTGGNSQTCNGNDNDNGASQGKGDCALPRCGDGYKNPRFTPPGTAATPEQCDTEGNSPTCNGNDNDNLTQQGKGDCALPRCGDGYKNPSFTPPGTAATPEQCDTGGNSQTCNGNDNDNATKRGLADCALPRCGDGYKNPAFTPPGANAPEQCDDRGDTSTCNGNNNGQNGPGSCRAPSCGDGYRNAAAGEACDPGDPENGISAVQCTNASRACVNCNCI